MCYQYQRHKQTLIVLYHLTAELLPKHSIKILTQTQKAFPFNYSCFYIFPLFIYLLKEFVKRHLKNALMLAPRKSFNLYLCVFSNKFEYICEY